MAVPPQVLVALGLSACADDPPVRADLDAQARGSDTCADTADTDLVARDTAITPCLSVQACLCTCENGAQTGGWMIPALGLLAVRRRREVREAVLSELPPDVVARLGGDR
ncbi:MAG: hypothetical protein R3F61_32715 [Myxococcota bacterium]